MFFVNWRFRIFVQYLLFIKSLFFIGHSQRSLIDLVAVVLFQTSITAVILMLSMIKKILCLVKNVKQTNPKDIRATEYNIITLEHMTSEQCNRSILANIIITRTIHFIIPDY